MSASRDKLRQRLRALLDKSVARGCTEAEALAAAEKAAQIMREHGLTEADLVIEQAGSKADSKGKAIKAQLWPVIAYCTNTAVVLLTEAGRPHVAFVGRDPGPEIAVYLRSVTERALDAGVRQFKASAFYRRRRGPSTKRQAVAEFAQGFVIRMKHRLIEVFGPSIDADARGAADQALQLRYPNTRDVEAAKASLRFMEARRIGWTSAGDVALSHGVAGGRAPVMIGGAA